MINYLEYICPIVCFVVCVLHSLVEGVVMSKQNKRIDKLCEICGLPIYDSIDHVCQTPVFKLASSLSNDELSIVCKFIEYLKGEDNG